MPEQPAPAKKTTAKEVISLKADEAVPDGYGLERFAQEVNILDLEGAYFSPSRTQTRRRANTTISLNDLSERPITIAVTDYGQPGETAYRVLQGIFFKLSEQGKATDGMVGFTWRELARLIDMSFGGRQKSKIYTVIKQLQRTEVSCSIRFKVRRPDGGYEKKWRAVSFTMLGTLAFEGSARGRFTQVLVEVNPMIVENFKNRHVSYFNWERMKSLDMVGMMLYKRFFRHFANIYREGTDRDALKFEKDYEQLCTVWLGLKPMPYRSYIERQLGKSLQALKAVRLLRDYRIEPKADGEGFKIVGFAGSGFFQDYEDMYRRSLPSPERPLAEPEPLRLLVEFHAQWGRQQEEFSPKEVAYARELQQRYSPTELRDFLSFACRRAAETNFDMQWLTAVSLYEGQWKAARMQHAAQAARQEAIKRCSFCNERGFLEFANGSVTPCPHDEEQVAVIHARQPLQRFRPN